MQVANTNTQCTLSKKKTIQEYLENLPSIKSSYNLATLNSAHIYYFKRLRFKTDLFQCTYKTPKGTTQINSFTLFIYFFFWSSRWA